MVVGRVNGIATGFVRNAVVYVGERKLPRAVCGRYGMSIGQDKGRAGMMEPARVCGLDVFGEAG